MSCRGNRRSGDAANIVPQARAKLVTRLASLLDGDEPVLGCCIHRLVCDMRQRWTSFNVRIADLDAEFSRAAQADERTRRLPTIPGIGALNATALVAAVGDARTFGRGRDLAAWMGLVPRQATMSGKPRLPGITKRGSRYLRKILIQGARSSLPPMSKSDTRLGTWLRGLLSRSHANIVVVALAATMARIVWALLRRERTYNPVTQAARRRSNDALRISWTMSAGGE
jgi:transposase